MPFWTKERNAGVWDFKEKAGNSQVDEKEQTCGILIHAGQPRNNRTQREIEQTDILGSPHLSHLIGVCRGEYAEAAFLKQVLLSECF